MTEGRWRDIELLLEIPHLEVWSGDDLDALSCSRLRKCWAEFEDSISRALFWCCFEMLCAMIGYESMSI